MKSSLKVKIFTNSIVIRNLNIFKAIISSVCLMAFKVFSIITEVPLKQMFLKHASHNLHENLPFVNSE